MGVYDWRFHWFGGTEDACAACGHLSFQELEKDFVFVHRLAEAKLDVVFVLQNEIILLVFIRQEALDFFIPTDPRFRGPSIPFQFRICTSYFLKLLQF